MILKNISLKVCKQDTK